MVKRRFKDGTDTLTTVALTKTAVAVMNQKEQLRNDRIARGISHPNDAIDTPGEVESIMNIGNHGRPIDTPIEVEQFLKKNAGSIERRSMGHKTKEEPDIDTPGPKFTP